MKTPPSPRTTAWSHRIVDEGPTKSEKLKACRGVVYQFVHKHSVFAKKWVLYICSGKIEFKMTFPCYRARLSSRPADWLESVHFIRADLFGQLKGLWQTSSAVLLLSNWQVVHWRTLGLCPILFHLMKLFHFRESRYMVLLDKIDLGRIIAAALCSHTERGIQISMIADFAWRGLAL